MLFNSANFLFLFLPCVLCGFFLLGKNFGKSAAFFWLAATSIFFYASWQINFVWLLLASLIFNFAAAKWIEKAKRGKLWIVGVTVFCDIALLVYYKLIAAGFFENSTATSAFSTTKDVLIPLAISFITFQKIAFIVDSYKGKLYRSSFAEYCLFITFFPQLIMGPIVHYRELIPQFRAPNILQFCSNNFALGISIFIIGLFKKVILADSVALYVNEVYAALQAGKDVSSVDAWVTVFAFQFQIYFDFSGYSDMAIGLARMFNINLPINFDSPYRATDRFDLWRRWHISFASFMRQYVFFPLARAKGINLPGALFITTMLSAFWHGLGMTFIVWGVVQSVIMLIVHYRDNIGLKRSTKKSGFNWMAMMATFFTTLLLGVFFRSPNLTVSFSMFSHMTAIFSDDNESLVNTAIIIKLLLMALIIWGFPNTQRFFGKYWSALDQRHFIPKNIAPDLFHFRFSPSKIWAAIMALIFVITLLSIGDGNRFIYYQF
jgi:alginate O-acetyltransferase complex protein AlgI